MTSIKLASFTILLTLIFQTILILGETLLTSEPNKDSGLKTPEKRNNFRVPMEMPYDPNFWPARGRRNRRDPEKVENCMTTDGNFGMQCPEVPKIDEQIGKKIPSMDFDFGPPILDEELITRSFEKPEEDCNGNVSKDKQGMMKLSDVLETNYLLSPKRFDKILHKKQRHFGFPPLIFYGNGFYWEPENLYGEKKKKQDVFWVARGKKNYNLNFPQK